MIEDQFRAAMRQAGLDYAGPIQADGKLHRIKAESDSHRNSWYVLHGDSPAAGAFGCWRLGISETWSGAKNGELSQAEWDQTRARWREAEQRRSEEEARDRESAKAEAARLLSESSPVTAHPYLARKGVKPCPGLRIHGTELIVPLSDSTGTITSIQRIIADGTKRFLRGGAISGSAFTIPGAANRIVICEGLATGISISEATGASVICAMNAGNLLAVAQGIRAKHPAARIVIAADDDRKTPGNPGLTAAKRAAEAIGAPVAVPRITPEGRSDFNDLAEEQGLGAVRMQIEEAEKIEDQNHSFSNRPAAIAGGKPVVILPGGGVTISDSARELFTIIAKTGTLFIRGRAVVQLIRNGNGVTVLEPLKPADARSYFERFAAFTAWRSGRGGDSVLKPTVPPEDTCKAYLESWVAREVLPRINGIVNCAVLVETVDGLHVAGKGFDATTGLLVMKGETPEEVPIGTAIQSLRALIKDFHFQSPGDESRALAAMITPAIKKGGMIRANVAADVREANDSQSGKGYGQRCVCAIYGEEPAVVPLKKGGTGSVDESLMEKLVNGRPFIQLDNFRGMLDSPALEALLTSERSFPCRVPGCREIDVDPSRFFVMLTSNGVETTRDLANRSSIVRILKRSGILYEDVLGTIRERQGFYLGCVFAVVREWHRRGKPSTRDTRHAFQQWCGVLDWIVQNIFGAAPLMDGHQAAQERTSNPALNFLRALAIEIDRQNRLDEQFTASNLYEIARDASIRVPGLAENEQDNEERGKRLVGIRLAPLFKTADHVSVEGWTVTREEEERGRDDGRGTFMVKFYRFTRKASNASNASNPDCAKENGTYFQRAVEVAGVTGKNGKGDEETLRI